MLLIRETTPMCAPLHPAEACVEFPLLLLDKHLAELEQLAQSAQRTIGQMIRQALGLYLAGMSNCCDTDGTCRDSQPDAPSDSTGVLAVTLLLPVSWLAELEAVASRVDTTAGTLIRRVVCFLLLACPGRQANPE